MSPIKGISEIVRLPRLGKIKMGIKEEGDDGSTYPLPTDHFVCPDEVKKVFGEKPKTLRIMFPTENSEQWASQYLRCYPGSRSMVCRGDGETAITRIEMRTSEINPRSTSVTRLKEISCNPDACSYHRRGDCRQVMNLQFLLPDCPGFGVYQLDTSSFHSMSNVNAFLELMRGTCQRVSMIPLSLELVERKVQPEGWLKTVHVLRLTCPHSLAEIQRFAQVPPGRALILPPPESEPPDDLFPGEPVRATETTQKPAVPDEMLLDLWARIKNRIWHFEIQDSQIANWFVKNYHLEVRLMDFDPPVPPAKLTAEILSAFCQSIDRYAGR